VSTINSYLLVLLCSVCHNAILCFVNVCHIIMPTLEIHRTNWCWVNLTCASLPLPSSSMIPHPACGGYGRRQPLCTQQSSNTLHKLSRSDQTRVPLGHCCRWSPKLPALPLNQPHLLRASPLIRQVTAWTAGQVSGCSGIVDHNSGIKIEFICISINTCKL
jgi:hypothetical protein